MYPMVTTQGIIFPLIRLPYGHFNSIALRNFSRCYVNFKSIALPNYSRCEVTSSAINKCVECKGHIMREK